MTEIINHKEVYNRILENRPYGKNLKPYTKGVIFYTIECLKDDEEYEKCQFLSNWLKKRFSHEENFLIEEIETHVDGGN
jgi:hypothetical protein